MNTDTPRTNHAIVRADGSWTYELREEMRGLERELNEANADRLRLRAILQSIDLSPCDGGSCMVATNADNCIQTALTTSPPPVVTKADADALADALHNIQSQQSSNFETKEELDASLRADEVLKNYRTKYPPCN